MGHGQAEEANPGLVHELIDAILESEQSKGGEESIEKLVRAAKNELPAYSFPGKTDGLRGVKARAQSLKTILSTIPDEIG